MYKKLVYIICLLSCHFFVNGQCEEIHLNGRVIDTNSIIKSYHLMLININTQQGTFGKSDGSFSLKVQQGDKIGISTKGYHKQFITIENNVYKCIIDTVIVLQDKIQEYEPIVVRPIRTLVDIKEEREAITRIDTRTVKGLDVFKSPITALYERFSKTAKTKQFIADAYHQENINSILQNLLRTYVAYDVVYLNEESFLDFIEYMSIDEHFLKTAKDYDLITFIQRKLNQYKNIHPELFK